MPSDHRSPLRYPLDHLLGTEANVRLLRLLAHEVDGPLNAPDAAERVNLSAPGARKALKRLSQTGFVVRVGGGRSQQYGLRSDEPILRVLRELFAVERERFDALLREIREALQDMREIRSAWIASLPAELGEPLELTLVVDPQAGSWIKNEVRNRLNNLERRLDQIIEISVYTPIDLPDLDTSEKTLLAGVPPTDEGVSSGGRRRHDEREERALRMSRGIAELIRKDPSIIKRATRHIERLMSEDQGTAAGDLAEWKQVLQTYSPERLRDFLESRSSRASRLRQSSPFFAILTPEERDSLMVFLEEQR